MASGVADGALAETASFKDLASKFYADEFRASPITATRVGIHDYDAAVDDLSAAGYAAEIARLHAALSTFQQIDPATLSDSDRDDHEVLISEIEGDLLDLETIRYWRVDPWRYGSAATGAIYTLVHRDFAPPAERLRSVIAREKLIPALLAQGRANIEHPPKIFVEIASRNVAGSLAFFRTGVPAEFTGIADPAVQAEFKTVNDQAIAALESYRTWLDHDLLAKADGKFALGTEVYARRLALKEMVDTPPDRLLEIARAQLAKDRASLATAAHKIDPNASVEDVRKSIRSQHPTAEALIPTARDELAGLRQFIVDHKLLTIPGDLLPKVEETPGFMRATTAAAMDWPGPFETHATQAFYYVTPPDAGLSPEKLDDYLRAYDYSGFQIISAHEVWPGHFMQYLTRRAHPEWSEVRVLAHTQSTTEGWAHYTEQMVIEQGLGGGDPKLAVGQAEEALLRDCRFIASIEMHTRGMSVDDAAHLFMKECGSPEAEARREAWRGTGDPGYLNYTV
ncbi:MAG TPA: DUF885 domain-containing protein, partial [Stellaceae bacterium]|nr:DUF885 domain-containing protein [Stellaceae bacterium]